MANLKTAIAAENEIVKAEDVTFGFDSTIGNVAIALKSILSNSPGDFVIGGKVKPYGSGGLNVSIEPIYAYKDSTGVCVVETDTIEPVSFEEADSFLDRIDIVEVQGIDEGYDLQSRKFNDPSTGTKTSQQVNTKKRIKASVIVKKGSNGSESAPAVDSGYVKLAEVRIPAGINTVTSDLIVNIDARKYGEDNTDWTTDKDATFNPSYLANIFYTLLVQHNEDGSHKSRVIKATNIDFGTGNAQVKGSLLPTGQSMSLHGADFTSSENVTALIQALVDSSNNLYKYSNDLLSRFSFLPDLPAACSTANVDITVGGEMIIDGVSVSVGQLVFLKNQTDAKENGFYEVQSGEWNRYAGYTSAVPDAFKHKLILIKTGADNKGKVFYLNGDFEQIGTDELNFAESNLSTLAKSYTIVARDSGGRIKAAAPVDNDDVTRKAEYIALQNITNTAFKAALLNFCYPVGSIYWSSNSTNPSELFGGTWTAIKDKFIWAKGDEDEVNDTGGEKTHALTINEMPSHNHTLNSNTNSEPSTPTAKFIGLSSTTSENGLHSHTYDHPQEYYVANGNNSYKYHTSYTANTSEAGNHTHTVTANGYITGTTDNTGSDTAHNNMPPYIIKYCWERTA